MSRNFLSEVSPPTSLRVRIVSYVFSFDNRLFFFFSSRRRHTRFDCDWSSDVCSSDLLASALSFDLQGDERDDGQQQIERQRAREEGNVVFESRLERPTGDAGHRPMPAEIGRASCRERV